MNAFTQVKSYTTKRAAVAALVKAGVAKADADKFYTEADGKFLVNLDAAKASLVIKASTAVTRKVKGKASAQGPDIDETEALAAAKPVKAAKVPKAERRTVSSVARELIRAGKSNSEVFAALDKEFSIGEAKKHYPGWYRSEMARAGEVYANGDAKATKAAAKVPTKAQKAKAVKAPTKAQKATADAIAKAAGKAPKAKGTVSSAAADPFRPLA